MRQLIYAVAGILMVATPLSAGENWANVKRDFPYDPDYAASKAICRKAGEPRAPSADRPTAAQALALKTCDSEALYYGLGRPADYAKARLCAFVEAQSNDDAELNGSTILMQVYANGRGVARNLDLATAYACRIDGAPADIDQRVRHVQALKSKAGVLDYCDDVTSDRSLAACAYRDSQAAAGVRDARIAALVSRLPLAARTAFPKLRAAFDAFVETDGDVQLELSGTAGPYLKTGEQDQVRDQFLRDLQRLVAGGWPSASSADAQTADAALNASYRKALDAMTQFDGSVGTPPQQGMRKAQRAWLLYRDAYVRFASVGAPQLPAAAVTARLTKLRTAQLDALVRED